MRWEEGVEEACQAESGAGGVRLEGLGYTRSLVGLHGLKWYFLILLQLIVE